MHAAPVFQLVPFTEDHGMEVCSWSYPPPYDLYNWRPWEAMLAAQEEFADLKIRMEQYRAVIDREGALWGFAQWFPMVGVTRLGLGMDPKRCGLGHGISFVRAIAEAAKQEAPDHEIDLEVLSSNARAYLVYVKAGFVHTDTYERMTPAGLAEFHCMVWEG